MSKIISVYGSSNCGKTTISFKLAKELSKNNNVILLHNTVVGSPLQTIFTKRALDVSVGRVLEAVVLTQKIILENLVFYKSNKNLGFIGYKLGENKRSYPSVTEDRTRDFIIELSNLADYLIIDCDTDIDNNLNLISMKLSDEIIRVCANDLKSISYFSSIFSLLKDKSFNLKNNIVIINKLKDEYINELKILHNKIDYKINYSPEINLQYKEGEIYEDLISRKSKSFNKVINSLVIDITGVDNKKTKKLFSFKSKRSKK